jgi:phosphate transport system protein
MDHAGFRVAKYDTDLQVLNDQMVELLTLVYTALQSACDALNEKNVNKAGIVSCNDDIIDDLERNIHKTASNLIMRYQPIARDLRQILASMRVASDLERIGDTAESIARRVGQLDDRCDAALARIDPLIGLVLERFQHLVEAYTARSVLEADEVRLHDADVDAAYDAAFGAVLSMMEADPTFVRVGAQLLSIAKSFERVGDRLTNVAEQILYEMEGATVFAPRADRIGTGSVAH